MPTRDDDRYASLVQALAAIASEPAEQARLLPALTRIASETRRGTKVELLDVLLTREGVLPAETGFLTIAQLAHLQHGWIDTSTHTNHGRSYAHYARPA